MRLIAKEGYRRTAIGLIPSEWKFVPINEIAQESTLRNGSNSELPVILCSKHVGFVRSLDYFKKKVFSDDTSNYKVVRHNWIAYPSNHIEEGSIGLQTICDAGIVSPIYTVFALNDVVEPDFIHRLLKTELYRQQYVAAMNGSVDRRGSLRWAQFSQIRVPLPPLSEQQKIAAILSAVDDKLAIIARQIEATQTLKRGLMQTLFSRGVGTQDAAGHWVPHTEFKDSELGQIPVGWKVLPISEVATVSPPRSKVTDTTVSVTFLGMADVSENGEVISMNSKNYRDVAKGFTSFVNNDVLVAKITPCFENGKGALVNGLENGLGFGSTEFHVIRVNEDIADARFIHAHTRTQVFRKLGERNMVGSAGQKRVTADFIKSYLIPVPPLLEQQRIASVLDSATTKLATLESRAVCYQVLKRGLMQKLLTGEWRVKLEAETEAA